MNTRRLLTTAVWAIVTLGIGTWALVSGQSLVVRALVLALVLLSLGYGIARLIAVTRMDRERPLRGGGTPHLVSVLVTGALMFGPLVLSLMGVLNALVAWGIALVAFALMQIGIALFSSGSRGSFLESLIFARR